jgi:hypothetical protein
MKRITKKAKLEFLEEKLGSDKRWCLNGLQRIRALQTPEEESYRTTVELNNQGFSKVHANIVTGLLKAFEDKKYLTFKQWQTLLKIAPRYKRQLLEISDEAKLIRAMQKHTNKI